MRTRVDAETRGKGSLGVPVHDRQSPSPNRDGWVVQRILFRV